MDTTKNNIGRYKHFYSESEMDIGGTYKSNKPIQMNLQNNRIDPLGVKKGVGPLMRRLYDDIRRVADKRSLKFFVGGRFIF